MNLPAQFDSRSSHGIGGGKDVTPAGRSIRALIVPMLTKFDK